MCKFWKFASSCLHNQLLFWLLSQSLVNLVNLINFLHFSRIPMGILINPPRDEPRAGLSPCSVWSNWKISLCMNIVGNLEIWKSLIRCWSSQMLEATNPGHIIGTFSSCNALIRKIKPHYWQWWTLRRWELTKQSRGNTKKLWTAQRSFNLLEIPACDPASLRDKSKITQGQSLNSLL